MTTEVPERHDPQYWRSVGDAWRARTMALAAGIILGLALLVWMDARRIVPDDLALGIANWAAPANYDGKQINAWRLREYDSIYSAQQPATSDETLWVGNSQLHAINQIKHGQDQVAAYYASEKLNQPVWCLSLPNENVQEQLVVLQWALLRRPLRWLVLPMVFDKLRNDGLRVGFELLASRELYARLETTPSGARLGVELEKLESAAKQSNDESARPTEPLSEYTWRQWLHGLSLQDVAERNLETSLSTRWALWKRRPELWATLLNDLYNMRNWGLGIKSTTKRPMLKLAFDRNMKAFNEILDVAQAAGVNVLVYIAPIRQDVEPPYFMSEYLPWKEEVARIVAARGAGARAKVAFADLDRLVPADLWGTIEGATEIDFMHFQGKGHELLGNRVAELLQNMRSGGATNLGAAEGPR